MVVNLPNPAESVAASHGARQHGQVIDILGRIKDQLNTLSPAERKVGSAVLKDVPHAVEDSIASLAQRAGVSEPTVTRFCRAIGCLGVRDFKLKLAQSLVVGDVYLNADTMPDAADPDAPAYWAPILSDARGAIREVERQLAPAKVQAAAEAIVAAKQVVTFGLGGSGSILAEETQSRMVRYGVNITCCREAYFMRMTAATLGPGIVVLAISASGKTEELIDAVNLARGYGATTIAITTTASPLSEAVDHALTVAVAETQDTLTPTSLRFAYLAIIDLLSAATGYTLGPKARESLRRVKYVSLKHRSGNILEPLGD